MKAEKFWLYFSLSLLLVAGLSLINLVVFLELKRLGEESLYRIAYQHFLNYLQNPQHRGDEDFLINPPEGSQHRIYIFEDPTNPLRTIRVGVREEFLKERTDSLVKRLLFLEFFLVFTLVFLYQRVVEGYLTRLREKEEWIKGLLLSLAHRLGNFLATQRVLLAILKKSHPEDQNLKRLEKSLEKVQRELSLFINPVMEDRVDKRQLLNLKELVEEILNFFEEEKEGKRLILKVRDLYVRMNREDLQDVLYNLIGNAIKHSRGFVHIKTCSRRDLLVVRNDMSPVENHGMGLGVELTRRILEKYGFRLKISLRKHYTAFIQFKKRE
ncbi:MAG: hypothetical protein WHS43_03205 [Aquificaceae bacterium]|uniref:sensor histidine kinase n=1 Tax=Hydrogenobacter sp. Uz 6-8 TaxID=3384828 RepID=UPI0030ABB238